MTKQQEKLVYDLRVTLLRNSYPPIFVVSLAELEAAEQSILEHLKRWGYPEILLCGENGLYFKGCELVLEVKES